jgi:hypothetical protein
MKQIYLILVLLASTIAYSQTNGISYQALILNPNPKMMPGVNQPNTALANQAICLQFVIEDNGNQVEYQETLTTTTDELGMVNVIIGSGSQTGGYAIDFKSVSWNAATKNLKVSINTTGSCGSFAAISDQVFNAVPFAFAATNVTGVVAIANGGTNASNVIDAKINLNLNNVDNTSDSNKPISNATQTALNTKAAISGQVFTGAVAATNLSGLNTGDQDLSSLATNVALGNKVDKVTAKSLLLDTEITRLSTLTNSDTNKAYVDAQDATNTNAIATEKNRALAAEGGLSGNVVINTAKVGITTIQADAIISNTNNLDLKANSASPTFTGTVTGIRSTMVGLGNVDNTSDATKNTATATLTNKTLEDNTTYFQDETDNTKKIQFQLAGLSTATTRILTVPDASGTIALISDISTATGSFVDLTTDQTVAGVKIFSSDTKINGISIGRGAGNVISNNTIGLNALVRNTTGQANTATGLNALGRNTTGNLNTATGLNASSSNTTGIENTANGVSTLESSSTGDQNTANGVRALRLNTAGSENTANGVKALYSNTTGNQNTANGLNALYTNTTGNSNTALGISADVSAGNMTNATAIGASAIVTASNSIQLGNAAVTNVKTNGTITAGTVTYPKTHNNTSGQVLTIDANGTSTWQNGASNSQNTAYNAGIWTINTVDFSSNFESIELVSASGFYTVIGNILSFSGSVELSGYGYGYGSDGLFIEIDLPQASNFTDENQISGCVSGTSRDNREAVSGYIKANASSNKLRVYLVAGGMGSSLDDPKIALSGMYIIR